MGWVMRYRLVPHGAGNEIQASAALVGNEIQASIAWDG